MNENEKHTENASVDVGLQSEHLQQQDMQQPQELIETTNQS